MANRPTTTPAILRAAADLIEARGLAKGGGYTDRDTGALCVYGAIHVATTGDPMPYGGDGPEWGAGDALARHLARRYPEMRPVQLIDWSDHPDRTAAEVAAAMRAAAQEVEK